MRNPSSTRPFAVVKCCPSFQVSFKIRDALGCSDMVAPISACSEDCSRTVISLPGARRATALYKQLVKKFQLLRISSTTYADRPAIPPPTMMIWNAVDDDILDCALGSRRYWYTREHKYCCNGADHKGRHFSNFSRTRLRVCGSHTFPDRDIKDLLHSRIHRASPRTTDDLPHNAARRCGRFQWPEPAVVVAEHVGAPSGGLPRCSRFIKAKFGRTYRTA